ncbi:MAG TPA: CocE/NonD family hydrolase [Candidatus Limiplasma sp.]|nr:CocE/NonD family hydrolase [Candidatus Limiplasma sp.]HRX09766.1 CocE/NonD family hydrolase [Candidatus Limiplasma sp.]
MNNMLCQFNVETPMRDGVILRGDLYRPQEQGKYPLLLWRSIFRKNTLARAFQQYVPSYFVQNGYVVFIQDVRGLGESDGEFDRFTADGKDGYDTIEWLAKQDYCDGNIGMIGNYYAGYLQLMAAAEAPPHLKAICPMQTSVSINRDCDNRGFMFYSHVGWCMSRQISRLRDGRYDWETTDKYLPMLLDYIKDYPTRQLLHRPLRDMPAVKNTPFPLLQDYYKHLVEGFDNLDLIHKEGRDMDVSAIRTPAFYISGWYDSSRTPLIEHCRAQRQSGVDSRVLIAPWKPGEAPAHADHALETGEITVDVQREMVEWFDHWLKGGGAPAYKAYRYYDIATRALWETDSWDEEKTTHLTYYLQGGGQLGSAPVDDAADEYLHDPLHPLPYAPYGSCGKLPKADAKRLTYVSEPSDKQLDIQGLVCAKVYLSSDAKDADVVVRLLDIDADGKAFGICDGATRARYRNSWTPEPLEAGTVYPIEVLLGYVHYTVAPGHRIALEICGSAFAKYDVNYGTAVRPPDDTDTVVSHNRIHCSKTYLSSLTLPLRKTRA